MAEKALFVNKFSLASQGVYLILAASATAPNVETGSDGSPLFFGNERIIDEDYLYLPMNIAKELAIALVNVANNQEKQSGLKFNLTPEKDEIFDAFAQTVEDHRGTN